MAQWGNKDSKTATGTVAITTGGAVTGSSTLFTTQAKIGNYIRVAGEDYQIVKIAADDGAACVTVIPGKNGATMTVVNAGASYTLSEKPAYVAHEGRSPAGTSGWLGDSTKVFGVDTSELKAGGDNVTEVAIANAGTGYVEVPPVTFSGGGGSSAAATATISANAVSSITITNVGSAYTSVPTVVVARPRLTIPTANVNTTTETVTYDGHKLSTGDALVYYHGGGTPLASTPTMTNGTTVVYANRATANTFRLYDTAVNAGVGYVGSSGSGIIDITGTGNALQYFEKRTATQATAVAALGEHSTGGSAHAGWVRRIVGTGGRAGRVQTEVLVAMGSITGDQADDIQYPDA
jgi:hypothetical protein